jgi:hypothetical protein
VDGDDFLIWQRQLGRTLPAVSVPEPGVAMACAAISLLARRRRRHAPRG